MNRIDTYLRALEQGRAEALGLTVSVADLKDFQGSVVWKALQVGLFEHIHVLRDELERMDGDHFTEKIIQRQAEIAACRFFVDLVDNLLENLEEGEDEPEDSE